MSIAKLFNIKTLLIILAIGVILYFGIFGTGSILPEETRIIDWNGIPVQVTTAFGTFINEETSGFCGSNDKDVTITNQVIANSDLVSSSSLSTENRACVEGQPIVPSENRILMEATLPAGSFVGKCESSNPSRSSGQDAYSSCKIYINGILQIKDNEQKTIQLSDNSRIKVEQTTQTGDISTSFAVYSNVQLSFSPDKTPETISTNPNGTMVDSSGMSLWDRINLWIGNFFNSIFGGSK